MSCGGCPRRIPLAGDNGPAFSGGGTAPASVNGANDWTNTPVAMLLVGLFLAVVAWKVLR